MIRLGFVLVLTAIGSGAPTFAEETTVQVERGGICKILPWFCRPNEEVIVDPGELIKDTHTVNGE